MQQQTRLYVHCGFPKTGSTALQAALMAARESLRQAGFLYPDTGGMNSIEKASFVPSHNAHYNIARQIMRNYMFDPNLGDLSKFASEIKRFNGNVIVSCEDIASVLTTPEALSPLIRLAEETQRELVFIIYLRDQISYCQSLYYELLKDGYGTEYIKHVFEILETGMLRFGECMYHFDYEKLLNNLHKTSGAFLIIRNYHNLTGGSSISDFAAALGLKEDFFTRDFPEKPNERQSNYNSLKNFYCNRIKYKIKQAEVLRIKYLAHHRTHLSSSISVQKALIGKFQSSNMRLCDTWKISQTGLDFQQIQKESEVTMDQFFSFEAGCAIRSGVIPDTTFAPPANKDTRWMAGIETAADNIPIAETIRYWREEAAKARRWYTSKIKNLLPFTTSPNSR